MNQKIDLAQILELARLSGMKEEEMTPVISAAVISDDTETLQDITEYLSYKAMPQIINPDPFFPPPEPEELEGIIHLGFAINGLE
jgi:hypothetical protein